MTNESHNQNEYDEDRAGKQLTFATVLNSEYSTDDGGWRSAFTPQSRITEVFTTLGWEGPQSGGLDTDDYLQNWVDLNLNDIEAEDNDGAYKRTVINDIDEPGSDDYQDKVVMDEDDEDDGKTEGDPDVIEQANNLIDKFDDEEITEKGFKKGVESLQEQDEVAVEMAFESRDKELPE
jgi:hypothetical protein